LTALLAAALALRRVRFARAMIRFVRVIDEGLADFIARSTRVAAFASRSSDFSSAFFAASPCGV
jgi:hypothetical protein